MIELHHPPSFTAHSLDRVTNNNVFQWTEEVTRYVIRTNVESEKPSQFQVCTATQDYRDPKNWKTDSVGVAFGA